MCPLSDKYRADLIALVERYRAIANVADSTVGRRAVNDKNFVFVVRDGRSFTIAKACRFEAWLHDALPSTDNKATGG